MPRISILTSLFCSEPYIQELYDRSRATVEKITEDYEIVFVDDGSPDEGNAVVKRIIQEDPRVRLIELSKNFGQHRALLAGLEHVRGELVFMIDSDLEEDPPLLETFYHKMTGDGEEIDVVYGVMKELKGGLLERLPGAVFYTIMNRISEVPVPRNAMGARLMTSDFAKSLLEYDEAQPFLGGIMALAGYKQVGVLCEKGSKPVTSYKLRRKVNLAVNALLSFSTKPLTWILACGCVITLAALLGAAGIALRGGSGAGENTGWEWILVSVWLLGGLVIISVGVVGLYVGRVFGQVKRRPNTIIRKIHN